MASPYELAFLSDYTYHSTNEQTTKTINIGGDPEDTYLNRSIKHAQENSNASYKDEDWAIIWDNGISDTLYVTKFQHLMSGQIVFAFRGTDSWKDWLHANIRHLGGRKSSYVTKAIQLLKQQDANNTIVTGHSLGGFMAMTMAFHFKNLKIVAFNPPQVVTLKGATMEQRKAKKSSNNFKSCKLLIYESVFDVASLFSKIIRFNNSSDWHLSGKNVKYKNIFDGGIHGIGAVKEYLEKHETVDIKW